jgi:hypothetical protein
MSPDLLFPIAHSLFLRAENVFKIDFLEFSIRDLDMPKGTSEIFAVRQSEPLPACVSIPDDIEVRSMAFGLSLVTKCRATSKFHAFRILKLPVAAFVTISEHHF